MNIKNQIFFSIAVMGVLFIILFSIFLFTIGWHDVLNSENLDNVNTYYKYLGMSISMDNVDGLFGQLFFTPIIFGVILIILWIAMLVFIELGINKFIKCRVK